MIGNLIIIGHNEKTRLTEAQTTKLPTGIHPKIRCVGPGCQPDLVPGSLGLGLTLAGNNSLQIVSNGASTSNPDETYVYGYDSLEQAKAFVNSIGKSALADKLVFLTGEPAPPA